MFQPLEVYDNWTEDDYKQIKDKSVLFLIYFYLFFNYLFIFIYEYCLGIWHKGHFTEWYNSGTFNIKSCKPFCP